MTPPQDLRTLAPPGSRPRLRRVAASRSPRAALKEPGDDADALQRPARTDDRDARARLRTQTGIKVQIRSADEATLANQIIQEGSSSPADVFYTENSPALEELGEKGLLAPVQPSTLARPAQRTARRAATGSASRRASRSSSTTPEMKADELPSSILQLAEPKFKGKVGFAPSETDFQPLVTSISKLNGPAAAESWLQGMKENGKVYPDNETVVAQVNNGESAIGPINHYYWYRLRAGRARRDALGSALLRSGRPGGPDQRLRRGRAARRATTSPTHNAARLPGRQGARGPRPQRQLGVPAAPGGRAPARAAPARRTSGELPDAGRSSATAAKRSRLEQSSGLL